MKQSTLLLCLLFSIACNAQVAAKDQESHYDKLGSSCEGPDGIFNIKGNWKKTEDDIVFPDKTFPRTQYKLVNTRIDSIYSLVKNAIPSLTSFEPRWQRGIRGDTYIPNGPVPYSLTAFFLEYYCNANMKKIVLGDETGNWVKICVNRFNWFLYQADTLDINNDGKIKTIFQLPPKINKWNGFDVYELKISTWFSSRSILIGRNGKLPWRSITQKQYLTGLKNRWEKDIKKFKPGSGYEKDYTNKLQHINDYLAITKEETLERAAIIDPKSGIWGFKGKFGDEEAGGFKLVLFAASEKYFDKTLPRYVPQLIQVYWSYGKSASALHFKNQFEENFPLEKLKAMIDK
ncbi:MAG: hypothetical protein ACXWV8_10530 [Chitinophagaceae bacterium]